MPQTMVSHLTCLHRSHIDGSSPTRWSAAPDTQGLQSDNPRALLQRRHLPHVGLLPVCVPFLDRTTDCAERKNKGPLPRSLLMHGGWISKIPNSPEVPDLLLCDCLLSWEVPNNIQIDHISHTCQGAVPQSAFVEINLSTVNLTELGSAQKNLDSSLLNKEFESTPFSSLCLLLSQLSPQFPSPEQRKKNPLLLLILWLLFETRPYTLIQAGFELLAIHLPQLPECKDYGREPPHVARKKKFMFLLLTDTKRC